MQENEHLERASQQGEAEYLAKSPQQRKEEQDIERAAGMGSETLADTKRQADVKVTFNLNWQAIENEIIEDAKKEAKKEGKECFLTDETAEKEFRTYLLEAVRGKLLHDLLKSNKEMGEVNDFIQREIEGELKGRQVGKVSETRMGTDAEQEVQDMAA